MGLSPVEKDLQRIFRSAPAFVRGRSRRQGGEKIVLCPEYSGKTNSPFRYPGGKFYARKLILHHIPQSEVYCEPFAGGGSIFFAKTPPSKVSILNDLDRELMNTYRQIKNNLPAMLEMLRGIPATKRMHAFFKNEFKPCNALERAGRWFYLNRTSYSGIMNPQNCFYGYGDKYSMRPERWPAHLMQVSRRLQKAKLTSLDFEEVIDAAADGAFLFVDPPYYNADQKKFYSCSFEQEDHVRLLRCLRRNAKRLRFLITYDNSPEVAEMYRWCKTLKPHEWNYTINRTDDQRNGKKLRDGHKGARYIGRELFIMNYNIVP